MLNDFLLGQPVEPGQIARELKKLWESSGGTKSRASLVNFAVVCEGAEALEANTQLISSFTRDHACRALLLAHVPASPQRRTQAWVNAHCHLARAGAKQVCCEQVTFLIEGSSQELLANTLFANLDSDLPLYLWWQGCIPERPNEQLWTWIDRLIFDSSTWSDPARQFALLCQALRISSRLIPCDLNWTRSLHLRQALAQMFDHPENLAQIPSLERLTLTHAPAHATAAILFAAWIAGQLGWKFQSRGADRMTFKRADDGEVACILQSAEGAPISRCELSTGDASVTIQRDAASAFLHAEVRLPEGQTHHHLLPAGADDLGHLLDEELTLGGRHRVYLKALATAEPML